MPLPVQNCSLKFYWLIVSSITLQHSVSQPEPIDYGLISLTRQVRYGKSSLCYLIQVLLKWYSAANQGSIFHWSRDHRLHHKFSDTELDPHTIDKGFFFAHCGWLLRNKSMRLVEEGRKIDMSDLEKDSIVMFQKKHYISLSLTMCFLVPTLVYYFMVGTPLWASFFLSFTCYISMLNATWCVNSICHMFGSRPYNQKI